MRRKKRIKRVLEDDLVKKGANLDLAQSYIMNLDSDDLTRVKDSQLQTDDYG